MNSAVPGWLKAVAVVLFLVIMAGVWWVARQLFYVWLPTPVVLVLAPLMLLTACAVVLIDNRRMKQRALRDPDLAQDLAEYRAQRPLRIAAYLAVFWPAIIGLAIVVATGFK